MPTQHVKLTQSLYLVEQPVEMAAPSSNDTHTHSVWLYDRSGSMYGLLPDLITDLKNHLKTLKIGDYLSVGWFSGEGSYRFIVRGFCITSDHDYAALAKILDSASTTMGATCFSEILHDTADMIDQLGAICSNFALCFFTDGYPVVSNLDREISSINQSIDRIHGKLVGALLVGYGHYYNKELMSKMSDRLGGFLIHSDNLETFSTAFTQFIQDSFEMAPKESVKLSSDPKYGIAFSINGKSIITYPDVKDGSTLQYSPSRKARNAVYFFTSKSPNGSEEVELDFDGTKRASSMARAVYAGAYVLIQKARTDEALELLASIGDVALISAATNSFTQEEYGKTESLLRKAVYSTECRFTAGRDTHFLPPEGAPCLIELIDVLMGDPSAKFFPYHKDFQYNRIGVKTELAEPRIQFKPRPDASSDMCDLTWNDAKLNLSILTKIDGSVNIPEDGQKLGFAKTFPCSVFRNYTLIKDGVANVTKIAVSMSDETFNWIASNMPNVIVSKVGGGVYILDISVVPVMNRLIARSNRSATNLAKLKIQEQLLMAKIKVVKGEMDALSKLLPRKETALSAEQEAYLDGIGLSNGIFSPKSVAVPPNDWYVAKEFVISVKGFSSLPKIAEAREKMKSGTNKLSPAMNAMIEGIQLVESSAMSTNAKVRLAQLEDMLKQLKTTLRTVRSNIQRVKFSILLGKAWFEEFTSREDNVIEVDGHTVSFKLREVKVEF